MNTFEFYASNDKLYRLAKEAKRAFECSYVLNDEGKITEVLTKDGKPVINIDSDNAVMCYASPGSLSGYEKRMRATIVLDAGIDFILDKNRYQIRMKKPDGHASIRVIPADKIHLVSH